MSMDASERPLASLLRVSYLEGCLKLSGTARHLTACRMLSGPQFDRLIILPYSSLSLFLRCSMVASNSENCKDS